MAAKHSWVESRKTFLQASRALDDAKSEIQDFWKMLIWPMSNVSGKDRKLFTIPLCTNEDGSVRLLEVNVWGGSIETFLLDGKGRRLLAIERESDFPRHVVLPLQRALPEFFDQLAAAFPERVEAHLAFWGRIAKDA